MHEQIIYLIGNAFRVYIYWKLLNVLFRTTKVKNIWIAIGFIVFFLINSIAAMAFGNFTLNIITNIVPLIALSFLYESKSSSKFFVALAFYVVNMLADGMMYAVTLVLDIDSTLISSGIGTVMFTFLLELIFEYLIRKQHHHDLDKLYFVAVITVPIGSIIIGVLTMSDYDEKVIAVSCILILFNVLIFYLYDRLQKNYETTYEKKILEQAVDAQHSQLELMKESQSKIRFLQHDFKNHLIAIENYAKRYDHAAIIKYIKDSFGFLSLEQQLVDTGNPEIDSILNYKLQEMQNRGIKFHYSVLIPQELRISGFDINIILGNLLNNAIEAMEKTEKKEFSLHIYFDKNILFLHMENTYNGQIIETAEGFQTTKRNKKSHGIGLKSVSKILEKYDGDIMYSHNDKVFTTDVMLCNIETKDKPD